MVSIVLSNLRAFGAFWYDFVIGDDWVVAAGVVIGLAITYALSHAAKVSSWWVVPAMLLFLLPFSLWRATSKD